MLAIIIVLALFSVLSFAGSIYVLVYLRKAVVKEHEHVQKLFRVTWKLKDHLQAQIALTEGLLISQLREMVGKAVDELAPVISAQLKVEQKRANALLAGYLRRELRKRDIVLSKRLEPVEESVSLATRVMAVVKRIFPQGHGNGTKADNGGRFPQVDTNPA